MKKLICLFLFTLLSLGCVENVKFSDKVVRIETDNSIGSGVIIQSVKFSDNSSELLILTAMHVLERDVKIYLNLNDPNHPTSAIIRNDNQIYTVIDDSNILRFYQKGREIVKDCRIVFYDSNDRFAEARMKVSGTVLAYIEEEDIALISVRMNYNEFKTGIGDALELNRGDRLRLEACINGYAPIVTDGTFNYIMRLDNFTFVGLANGYISSGSSGGAIFKDNKLVGLIRAMPVNSNMVGIQNLCLFTLINKELIDRLKMKKFGAKNDN